MKSSNFSCEGLARETSGLACALILADAVTPRHDSVGGSSTAVRINVGHSKTVGGTRQQ